MCLGEMAGSPLPFAQPAIDPRSLEEVDLNTGGVHIMLPCVCEVAGLANCKRISLRSISSATKLSNTAKSACKHCAAGVFCPKPVAVPQTPQESDDRAP